MFFDRRIFLFINLLCSGRKKKIKNLIAVSSFFISLENSIFHILSKIRRKFFCIIPGGGAFINLIHINQAAVSWSTRCCRTYVYICISFRFFFGYYLISKFQPTILIFFGFFLDYLLHSCPKKYPRQILPIHQVSIEIRIPHKLYPYFEKIIRIARLTLSPIIFQTCYKNQP